MTIWSSFKVNFASTMASYTYKHIIKNTSCQVNFQVFKNSGKIQAKRRITGQFTPFCPDDTTQNSHPHSPSLFKIRLLCSKSAKNGRIFKCQAEEAEKGGRRGGFSCKFGILTRSGGIFGEKHRIPAAGAAAGRGKRPKE
jgi:hypothetical protein